MFVRFAFVLGTGRTLNSRNLQNNLPREKYFKEIIILETSCMYFVATLASVTCDNMFHAFLHVMNKYEVRLTLRESVGLNCCLL
jgi:hypothetical protein